MLVTKQVNGRPGLSLTRCTSVHSEALGMSGYGSNNQVREGEARSELRPDLTLPCTAAQQKNWYLIGPEPSAGATGPDPGKTGSEHCKAQIIDFRNQDLCDWTPSL